MKKTWIIVLLGLTLVTLIGCSNSGNSGEKEQVNTEKKPEKAEKEPPSLTGFISKIEEGAVLIGDIFYRIEKSTKIVTEDNQKLAVKDLKLGMKVKAISTGPVDKSFPGHTSADQITVLTDETSKKEEKAVAKALEQLEADAKTIVVFGVKYVEEKKAYEVSVQVLTAGEDQGRKVITIEENTIAKQ